LVADITVFHVEHGNFGYADLAGEMVDGTERISAEMTIRPAQSSSIETREQRFRGAKVISDTQRGNPLIENVLVFSLRPTSLLPTKQYVGGSDVESHLPRSFGAHQVLCR